MTREELKSRLIKVNGKAMPDKSDDKKKSRRGLNYVQLETDDSSAIDDFFEYEKELSEIESASSLDAKFNKLNPIEPIIQPIVEYSIPEVIVPSFNEYKVDTGSFLILEEEIITEENIATVDTVSIPKIKVFEFKYCQYKKEDGTDCKRQAPKNGNYCSSHKKMVNKE